MSLFPNLVSDPKRRSKVMLDRLFCCGCVLLCTTGPTLMGLGTALLFVTDDLSSNIETYNAAVQVTYPYDHTRAICL
jgi:hypothetical protein